MPKTIVTGAMNVSVDVREVMNSYVCNKVGIGEGQYADPKFALDDLGAMLVSLGKDRGIKIKVVIDHK